jgi:molybdopterin-guanine dinucleotide biosynthesis protein A
LVESGVLGILLAGGMSRRFGEPKAGVRLDGRPLAEIALGKLMAVAPRVGVVAARAGSVPGWDPPADLQVRGDDPPGIGPLAGLATALDWAGEIGAPGILVLPVDLPFLPIRLLTRLAELGRRDLAAVPLSRGPSGCEPLCAWYGVGLLGVVREAIGEGERSPTRLLDRISVHWLSLAEVEAFGDPDSIFRNVNRPEDLLRGRAREVS